MPAPRAILWDVDGTLAETERDGHRVAFNLAFEACGVPWRWDEAHYGRLLEVTGGRERLLHDMAGRDDAPAGIDRQEALARAVHARKNTIYAGLARGGGIPLRGGVLELMQQCRDGGRPMGITTTTSRANVAALLAGPLGAHWEEWFAVIVCGEDVSRKKPDPEVYDRALAALRIAGTDALAIEDSPAGVAAAHAAGLPVIVTRSRYFADAPIEGARAVGPGLHTRDGWRPALPGPGRPGATVGLDDIDAWCGR